MILDDLELELRKLPGVRAAGFNQREDVLLVQLHADSTENGHDLPVQALRIAYRHSEQPVALEIVRWRERPDTAPADDADGDGGEAMVDLSEPEAAAPLGSAADTQVAVAAPGAEPSVSPAAPETPPPTRERRVRLLAVLSFPDTNEIEVHLTLEGRRSIGRAEAGREANGAVDATLDALRQLAPTLEYELGWTREIEPAGSGPDQGPLYAVGLRCDGASPPLHGIARGNGVFEAATRATLHALNRTLALELWAAGT